MFSHVNSLSLSLPSAVLTFDVLSPLSCFSPPPLCLPLYLSHLFNSPTSSSPFLIAPPISYLNPIVGFEPWVVLWFWFSDCLLICVFYYYRWFGLKPWTIFQMRMVQISCKSKLKSPFQVSVLFSFSLIFFCFLGAILMDCLQFYIDHQSSLMR